MADSTKMGPAAESQAPRETKDLDREHSEKVQSLGRSLVSSLFMLVRSAKMYESDNAVFAKPLASLQEIINQIIAVEGTLDVRMAKDAFYVNAVLVRMDASSLDNVRHLQAEMEKKSVGGLSVQHPVSAQELKSFVSLFSKDPAEEIEEDGSRDAKLTQIKLIKLARSREPVGNFAEGDRKKYAIARYARCVFFLRRYIERMKQGKPMAAARAACTVQDLVDLCDAQRPLFLGMTTFKDEADYHVFHHVNVALMAVAFGKELGLTKARTRDLGLIALFHETGLSTVPHSLLRKPGALTGAERMAIQRGAVETIKQILAEKNLSRQSLMRLAVISELKRDFGKAVKDRRGNIQTILPMSPMSVYAKIIRICCVYDALTSKRPFRDPYSPEIALTLMWTEMRDKFDPELLRVFMKVMAIPPVRVLPKDRKTVELG